MAGDLDAYLFELRRQAQALVLGTEPDGADPLRRIDRALLCGVLVGGLALAAVAVVRLLGRG